MVFSFKRKPSRNAIEVAIKIFLVLFVFTILMAIVYVGIKPYRTQMREGDISLRDIFAPFNFMYFGKIDEKATDQHRQQTLSNINPVYQFDSSKLVEAEKGITEFFESVKNARKTTEIFGDDEKLKTLRSSTTLELSDDFLLVFIQSDKLENVEATVKRLVYEIADRGILTSENSSYLRKNDVVTVTVRDSVSNETEELDVESFLTKDKAKALIEKELADIFGRDRKLKKATVKLTLLFLEPNLKFDDEYTQKRKEEALSKVSPVHEEILVQKNELLLARGQKISKVHLKKLDRLNILRSLQGKLSYLIGLGIIIAIFLALAGTYLRIYQPKVFNSNKNLVLIALNIIFIAVISEVIVLFPTSSYLIPIASIAMLLTILIGADVAFLITILMSIFCGVIAGDRFGITIVCLVGSCVGIYSVRKARRRSQLFLGGFLVGGANFLCIIGIGYLNSLMPMTFLVEGMWGLLNGFLSFFIVIGLLPILEYLFKITTDITLLELSDLNHPILKDMVIKAPGTYHHSLLVGNLAEAACDAIGANSLLARVGSYYHDIGKVEKAGYFSENETDPNSRHEALTPSMSALVITSHVRDGVELARKHTLNPVIIDFIEQHHGTSLIYYFYQKALEKGLDEKQLKEEEFRYPGPRPQTKEAAIVLLADSVEASSRTLANPIPSRIRELVQRIINNKFIDNQLDDCELTLKDLHRISDSFVRTLSGVFHTRIEYPKEKEASSTRNRNGSHRNRKFNGNKNSAHSDSEKDNKKSS